MKFFLTVARAIVHESVSRVAVASVADGQINADLRASAVVLRALVHVAEFGALVFPADAIRIFVTDFVQRDARAFAAFELQPRIAAHDFAGAIPLVASVRAVGFTVAIQMT